MGVQVQVEKELLSGGLHALSAVPGKGAGGRRVLGGALGQARDRCVGGGPLR